VLPPSFGTRLALDTGLGIREGVESLERDPAPGGPAHAIGLVLDPVQRPVDLVDDLARGRGEQEVALTFDIEGVAFAGFLVELGVATLAVVGQRFRLGLELLGLMDVLRPLLEQLEPQSLDRAG